MKFSAKSAEKSVLALFSCVLLLICSGCSGETISVKQYKKQSSFFSVDESVVADKGKFSLLWDQEKHNVILKDKNTGRCMSSTPYSYYTSNESNSQVDISLKSPLIIKYFDDKYAVQTAYASTKVLTDSSYSAKKIENGLQVVYFFESQQIAIPIRYLLCENGLEVRIMTDGIREGINKLYSITLLPGFVSVRNTSDKDTYLFIPSGSGTLMYTDDNGRQQRQVSMPVYGDDPTISTNEKLQNTESCRLPVFGARDQDGGVLAVLGEGSELATIEACAGNSSVGYSNACVTYNVRGTDLLNTTNEMGAQTTISLHTDDIVNQKYTSVTYYPLSSENSDYVSMAEFYREKLFGNSKSRETVSSPVVLDFYGAVRVNDRTLGISYTKIIPLTTFEDIKEISEEVNKKTGIMPQILLTGYGESGASFGKIAGGFEFADVLGGKKGFNSLKKYCDKNNSKAILDVDMIFFAENGKGISKNDSAKKVSSLKSKLTAVDIVTHRVSDEYERPYILSKNSLDYVVEKLLGFIGKREIEDICLGTLGSYAYSDFSDRNYYCKANTSNNVSKIMSLVGKNGRSVYTRNANSYAAKLSTGIFEIPTQSSKFDGMDLDIPFYEIVFKGFVSMSVSPLNLAADLQTQYLKAVEMGCGISFSVCKNWDYRLSSSQINILSRSDYDGQKENIVTYTKNVAKVTDAVGNSKITSYRKEDGVSYTEFENGVKIVTNFGNSEISTEYGKISPYDYLLVTEGEKD